MDDGNSVKDLEQVRMGATKVSYEPRLCCSGSFASIALTKINLYLSTCPLIPRQLDLTQGFRSNSSLDVSDNHQRYSSLMDRLQDLPKVAPKSIRQGKSASRDKPSRRPAGKTISWLGRSTAAAAFTTLRHTDWVPAVITD